MHHKDTSQTFAVIMAGLLSEIAVQCIDAACEICSIMLIAEWFNAEHGREGTLYERRFHDVVVEDEGHAIVLARYVALNPVRVDWVDEPEDWLWSSYAPTVGLAHCPRYLSTKLTLGSSRIAGKQLDAARLL